MSDPVAVAHGLASRGAVLHAAGRLWPGVPAAAQHHPFICPAPYRPDAEAPPLAATRLPLLRRLSGRLPSTTRRRRRWCSRCSRWGGGSAGQLARPAARCLCRMPGWCAQPSTYTHASTGCACRGRTSGAPICPALSLACPGAHPWRALDSPAAERRRGRGGSTGGGAAGAAGGSGSSGIPSTGWRCIARWAGGLGFAAGQPRDGGGSQHAGSCRGAGSTTARPAA